jgi:hypothetical protein
MKRMTGMQMGAVVILALLLWEIGKRIVESLS